MRIEVELHPDVVWFVKHRCSEAEADEFLRQLEALRREPIRNSESISEPRLSRYMLRFFRFAGSIAIFDYNAAKNRMWVLECRVARPRRRSGHQGDDTGVP